jgi:hypothetical protein
MADPTKVADLGEITINGSRQKTETLSGFLASFQKDVARQNRFDVLISSPPILQDYANNFDSLTYRCESAQLPSRTFGTVDQKFGSNPTQKFPMHTSYNDLQLTFIVSGNMKEKNLFDVWMEFINPTTTFDFTYKEDFMTSITVTQYDLSNKQTYSVEFHNAFPIAVNQLDLDWSNDGHHKLTVDFTYDYWNSNIKKSLGLPTSSNHGVGVSDLAFYGVF